MRIVTISFESERDYTFFMTRLDNDTGDGLYTESFEVQTQDTDKALTPDEEYNEACTRG